MLVNNKACIEFLNCWILMLLCDRVDVCVCVCMSYPSSNFWTCCLETAVLWWNQNTSFVSLWSKWKSKALGTLKHWCWGCKLVNRLWKMVWWHLLTQNIGIVTPHIFLSINLLTLLYPSPHASTHSCLPPPWQCRPCCWHPRPALS